MKLSSLPKSGSRGDPRRPGACPTTRLLLEADRLAFLDTRTKILSEEDARQRLRGRTAQWVAGHFDPLLAEHVRRLRQCATRDRPLVVEITNPPRPLLAQRARAELVAALGMVDYVVLKNGEPEAPGDADVTERFIQDVLRRHRPEGSG
jgi:bifunctional ADP-heptose synthase (sugar kinase/adenylyltransferase)